MLDLAVIILTYNERLHIERAILSVLPVAKEVFVVDSFSTDGTVEIATGLGARVVQHVWEENHARQFNWGLDTLPIAARWVLRLDADEYLTEELVEELRTKLPALGEDVTGGVIPRKQYFFDKPVHPLRLLRLFRYRHARTEERWMDEHVRLLDGRTAEFDNLLIDHNHNTLGWWIEKHNGYSIREAIDLLDVEYGLLSEPTGAGDIGKQASAKRRQKLRYARSPLFWRSTAYFLYRYVVKLGFVGGKPQFLWDFFQGWWYRTPVDAKIYEIKRACGTDKEKMLDYIRDRYGIDCRKG